MDPITFSIIRHRLYRIVDEAVITLKNVSGSAITNEGHDLMVSLYRADGSLLMGGVGFLHHLTSAAEACKAIIRRFGDRIEPGDVYLLCSDGLCDMVEDDDIGMTLSALGGNLKLAAQQLVQMANDNGGKDNVSVILVRVLRDYPAQRGVVGKVLGWLK